jgi:hypothetical protein
MTRPYYLLFEMNDQQLNLMFVRRSRKSGHWSDDDYDVRFGNAQGRVVGRVFKASQSPSERPWYWTITSRTPQRPTARGFASTRKDAVAAFRAVPKGRRNI